MLNKRIRKGALSVLRLTAFFDVLIVDSGDQTQRFLTDCREQVIRLHLERIGHMQHVNLLPSFGSTHLRHLSLSAHDLEGLKSEWNLQQQFPNLETLSLVLYHNTQLHWKHFQKLMAPPIKLLSLRSQSPESSRPPSLSFLTSKEPPPGISFDTMFPAATVEIAFFIEYLEVHDTLQLIGRKLEHLNINLDTRSYNPGENDEEYIRRIGRTQFVCETIESVRVGVGPVLFSPAVMEALGKTFSERFPNLRSLELFALNSQEGQSQHRSWMDRLEHLKKGAGELGSRIKLAGPGYSPWWEDHRSVFITGRGRLTYH